MLEQIAVSAFISSVIVTGGVALVAALHAEMAGGRRAAAICAALGVAQFVVVFVLINARPF